MIEGARIGADAFGEAREYKIEASPFSQSISLIAKGHTRERVPKSLIAFKQSRECRYYI